MALRFAFGLVLSLFASQAIAWTYTEYLSPVGTQGFSTVTPTGSVSASSSETASTQYTALLAQESITLDVTVTKVYLASGSAPICGPDDKPCSTTSTSTSTGSGGIDTTVYAPIVITNLPSCTLTSYSYTTSISGHLGPRFGLLETLDSMPGVLSQATNTGPEGPALAVSTYVVTLSTNLGGQAVTTTRCDIFLKPGQVSGLRINSQDEQFMEECVDPRLYRCLDLYTMRATPTCGTEWIGTYGQGRQTAAATSASSGGGNAGPKPNGAWGRQDMARRWVLVGAGVAALCFML